MSNLGNKKEIETLNASKIIGRWNKRLPDETDIKTAIKVYKKISL